MHPMRKVDLDVAAVDDPQAGWGVVGPQRLRPVVLPVFSMQDRVCHEY